MVTHAVSAVTAFGVEGRGDVVTSLTAQRLCIFGRTMIEPETLGDRLDVTDFLGHLGPRVVA